MTSANWRFRAQNDFDRAMTKTGEARMERLSRVTQEFPLFAPAWLALAEHHLRAGRKEEAQGCAKRVVGLDSALYWRFSGDLKAACSHLLPAHVRESRPAPEVREIKKAAPVEKPASGGGAAGVKAEIGDRQEPAAQGSVRALDPDEVRKVAAELARARALLGPERRERYEELCREYPDHAPVWLAMAEDSMASRRVEEAIAAANRTLELDATAVLLFSPELAAEYRYAGRHAKLFSNNQALSAEAPDGRLSDENVSLRLRSILEIGDPAKRLSALKKLCLRSPNHPDVLFYIATDLAALGERDELRRVGRHLKRADPDRYEELIALLDSRRAQKRASMPPGAGAPPVNGLPVRPQMGQSVGPPASAMGAVSHTDGRLSKEDALLLSKLARAEQLTRANEATVLMPESQERAPANVAPPAAMPALMQAYGGPPMPMPSSGPPMSMPSSEPPMSSTAPVGWNSPPAFAAYHHPGAQPGQMSAMGYQGATAMQRVMHSRPLMQVLAVGLILVLAVIVLVLLLGGATSASDEKEAPGSLPAPASAPGPASPSGVPDTKTPPSETHEEDILF